MKLKKFLLRYYPPGVLLEYEHGGIIRQKSIDLLNLTAETDVEVLLSQIIRQEPLISEARRPALRKLIHRLIEKVTLSYHQDFSLFKVIRGAAQIFSP